MLTATLYCDLGMNATSYRTARGTSQSKLGFIVATVRSPNFRTIHIAVDILCLHLMAGRGTEDIQDVSTSTMPGQLRECVPHNKTRKILYQFKSANVYFSTYGPHVRPTLVL